MEWALSICSFGWAEGWLVGLLRRSIGLTIRVVDRSVHVKHTFDVPITQEVLDSIELQQNMADMFALQQQPAIVFPLSITPLDCGLSDNAARPGC